MTIIHLLKKDLDIVLRLHSSLRCTLSSFASQRPPIQSQNKNNLIIYSARKEPYLTLHQSPGLVNKDLRRCHAILLPHILCDLSSLGAPFLDYYHHPIISITLVFFIFLYPCLYMGSPRISRLSMNSTKDYLFIKTGFCHQALTVPLDVCSFDPNKKVLGVNGHKFRFLVGGEFESTNTTIMKQLMRENLNCITSIIIPSRFNLFCSEILAHNEYVYLFLLSVASILLCYMFFGYTDVMCPIIEGLALIDKQVLDRWKEYMIK